MAQEQALGPARALDDRDQDLSKEELQRRMEEARDSISTTVTEIRETVAQQVQTVKDTLDWREQYRKRPLVWSLGAMGAGFFLGYRIAGAFKHEEVELDYSYMYGGETRLPAAQPASLETETRTNGEDEGGPGLFQRFKETPAFDRLRSEVATLGDRFVEELSQTAQQVVLPMVIQKIRNFIGVDLSQERASSRRSGVSQGSERAGPEYQPTYERPS